MALEFGRAGLSVDVASADRTIAEQVSVVLGLDS
jgi:hypothetical protein